MVSRPLSLDDIFSIEQLRDAQISPDGSQIAFVVGRDYVEGENKTAPSSIWLVPSDGAAPARQFTHGPHADVHPRWSPDGRTIAFLSDREKADTFQIYTISLAGGEAPRLTDAKAGVASFKWSPDGAQIAYLAPDADSEEEEQRKKDKDDAIHLDHDYKFTRLWVIDSRGGVARAITPPEYQVREFAWYGDGWAIFTSPTPLEDENVRPFPLMRVIEGGLAEILWRGRHSTLGLSGSSDGRALAWLHGGADAEESADEVWALLPDSAPRCVAVDYVGGLSWTGWTSDRKALLVTGIESTRVAVGRITIESGAIETLLSGRTLSAFVDQPQVSISRDGGRIACVIEDGTQTSEIWTGETRGDLRQVTSFNQHLNDVALGAVETIRWNAPDGLAIEGVLIRPSNYNSGQRYPLIVLAHGGPTWQWTQRFMASWHDWGQLLAANGYAVLLPNPRGSFGRGRDFTHRNRRAWGIGDLDDFLSGVDYLVEQGLADPDRLGIGGWSYGGYIASWAIGHTRRFKAAVVGAGVTNLLSFQASDIPSWLPTKQMQANPYSDPELYVHGSPMSYAANITTPTLILHGANDERVRLGQGRELYNALRYLKVPVKMVIYPRETHFIMERHHQRDIFTRVVKWYDRWIKVEAMESGSA
jgi:dipeptidyl aminopeptidase/acylaminoacyl peptidase